MKKCFSGIYESRRVLVTGHTGFKGSWLTCWLHELGAIVNGYSLETNSITSHFDLLDLPGHHKIGDIRDYSQLSSWVSDVEPDIIFHMAAQPLVRKSYEEPIETFGTNIMGTANVLDVALDSPTVKAVVVITSDKCYENDERRRSYQETDRLGGHDPYSASKACAELISHSYRKISNGSPSIATARAGNVIGGGDWAEFRLIPDIARAVFEAKKSVSLRSPLAVRPWQHVLEPLAGYLRLGEKLLQDGSVVAEGWNFGPDVNKIVNVKTVVEAFSREWPTMTFSVEQDDELHESEYLTIDSDKARRALEWMPIWDLPQTVKMTADWYQQFYERKRIITVDQIYEYVQSAREKGCMWTNI